VLAQDRLEPILRQKALELISFDQNEDGIVVNVRNRSDNTETTLHVAIGRTGLDVKIIIVGQWDQKAVITDKFSHGRMFFAGDSATS
jgi:hypothetical protein